MSFLKDLGPAGRCPDITAATLLGSDVTRRLGDSSQNPPALCEKPRKGERTSRLKEEDEKRQGGQGGAPDLIPAEP